MQATEARAAISKTFKQIQKDLAKGADPRLWLREHPWATLAAATASGFGAASTVVPSKEQQALKRLARLERALHPEWQTQRDDRRPGERGMVAKIFSHAMGVLEPALMSILSEVVAEKVSKAEAEDLTDADASQSR